MDALTRGQPPAPANFRDWKHSLQNTGRPWVGLKGTVVSLPQFEHVVTVSTRSRAPPPGPPDGREARFVLHDLQRLGSFLKFLSAKNCCSPAVQMNSVPQSIHVRCLSWNSIGASPLLVGWVTRARAASSCGCACAQGPAWPDACHRVSDRRNAS